MTDSKVNLSSYKKSGKKCDYKKEIKFKEDFSKLLEKIYEQNANKRHCSILSNSQLKTCKRKREIPEYEEDISNKLQRMKLYDIDKDDNNTENENLCSSFHPSNLSVYPNVPGYALNSYIDDTENNAFIRSKKLNVLHFKPMIENLDGGNELQTLLFPVTPVAKQDIRNTLDNFFNKTDTEFCFSHCTYPENVSMFEILKASFASKTNLYSFRDVQTSVIHSKRASNYSNFNEENQNENNMSPEIQVSNNLYVTATDGNLDDTSLIKKTILDLFLLEIKIKQCKAVLKKFNITSDSHDGFKKSKLKSAKLIKTYKILMNKRNKENTRLEKSRKRAFIRKNVLVEDTSVSNVGFSNTSKLVEKEEEKYQGVENEIKNSLSRKKRNQKIDDNIQKPGRSKTLDECIKRANNARLYSSRSIKVSKCLEEKKVLQNQNFKESRNTIVSIKRELLFTKEMYEEDSHDSANQTIDKILSQLPPVENIMNTSQTSNENKNNIALNESMDYGDASDKSFVIFPYVTT